MADSAAIGAFSLPPALRERVRAPAATPISPPRAGTSVVYLLRTCFRAHHNPALEVALRAAAALDVPLICVAVVEDTFPTNMRGANSISPPRRPTDRAAAFRLEALRELQPEFEARGTVLLVHVERDGCRPAVAMSLAAKARLVVTDEHFGVEPHASAVARVAQVGAPVWLCDCHCTVPSVLLSSAALSGGNAGFLRASAALRSKRLDALWLPPPAPPPPHPPPASLPSWSMDLSAATAIEDALAMPSRRDASVGRVRHTRGGPRAAAARWAAYVHGGGLRSYASHRNNPLANDGKGASRMSAYVNAGMICPYAMARDAAAARCEKYLSEFVGFRESSHLWCLLHPGEYAVASAAVPGWAREQMRRHSTGGDSGQARPTLEELEAGRSGDALWDDCQRCLVISGELHNNVSSHRPFGTSAGAAAHLSEGARVFFGRQTRPG